jgi:cell division septum initiation protein DivIVA
LDNESVATDEESGPAFNSFRHGYDPQQVDSYIADQESRLRAATGRASEAERKLTAAVGQLRELHRRVSALEAADRNERIPALDTMGEQIQKILQDAWEGAFAIRQSAERDAAELRERAKADADAAVEKAHRRAEAVGVELAKRRESFLQRIEAERSKAVAQTTFLQGQRKIALGELEKLRGLIDKTVEEFGETQAAPPRAMEPVRRDDLHALNQSPSTGTKTPMKMTPATAALRHPANQIDTSGLARTMPVHRLPERAPDLEHDASALVRSHREQQAGENEIATVHALDLDRPRARPSLFDFAATEEDDR